MKFPRLPLKTRAPKTQPGQFRVDRARVIYGLFCGAFAVIAGRAVMLHLFPSNDGSLHKVADNQYQNEVELAPYRGTIFDHKGEPLAISIRRPSLAVNPRQFDPTPAEVKRLAQMLRMPVGKIRKIADKKSYFAWLTRQIDPHVADEVGELGLKGLVQITEPARFYPAGTAAAHILGFTGLDNAGLAGLERQFDKDLRGQPVKVITGKDARGKFIFTETNGAAPLKQGNNIYLTLDRVIQEITEDELEVGARRAHCKKAFAIVADPHTGRILAIANYPNFDPNDARRVSVAETTNHALIDLFEPGSVVKPFVIGRAIELKKARLDEVIDTEGGKLRIGKYTIHDDHKAASLPVREVIIRSSNIGTYKIAARLGKQRTFEALKDFGFSLGKAQLGFPGEAVGRISPWAKWEQIRFANTAFGHGFVITGMELVQAMGALANGGNVMKPTLVEKVVSADGSVVMSSAPEKVGQATSPETARVMRNIMREVVEDPHGTAHLAKTKDYSTAGKTGTAQKVVPGIRGYAKDKFIASFVGFSPVEDPHLVIYVQVDEPGQKPYYGGTWAAPIFSGITERSLKYLNVAPDISREIPKPVAAGSAKHGAPTAAKL